MWTFDEGVDDWVNDASNWNQKWQLSDAAICLSNVPVKPKKYSATAPWLSGAVKVEDKAVKKTKSPLWGPPIPQAIGMRCITMDYAFSVESGDYKDFSLALLQQQDG